ncbi:Zn-dependent M28 family amino/carboxypeptidase [Brevundimonas alba]|uniref:Zn-dependent M28 family amino/carboxypeptidase n=1 Tax=Brevundimonas alba TaxID=74314 RepID=A0A7X5YK85_9CAUL|nr:M28 family peptidase [Brevundimonas alba]NJC41472.1 Zn-dependent M28 family amino/carboxypeptidase [Brevundimonas alba]
MFKRALLLSAGLLAFATAATAQSPATVDPVRVAAHENFLAGEALRGRGSATPDEAVAAAYVAARFQEYGLTPAPGMSGYLQTAGVVQQPPSAPGRRPRFTVTGPEGAVRITTNAIGWLQGSDPSAGVIMITAHLDHLGVQPDGTVRYGANDDASGTTAVLELARTLAAGERPKRSILFVCYGSEELGLLGSEYFGSHSPVPLTDVIANLEIEMIGAQDPNMPAGVMMMTGFDRSNFGAALKERGALIAPDLYPEQHFFERSDNYQLALQGVVAHTISGWATIPTYHTAEDDLAHLDIPFMTQAIQSLVEPLRWLASTDFKPEWAEGGRPQPRQ